MTCSRVQVHIPGSMHVLAAMLLLGLVLQPQSLFSANVEVLYAPNDAPLDTS